MNSKFIKYFILAFYLIILVKTAWMCGDAYHGLRVVDNFVKGYGLTYNIVERVQVQTANTWVFVMAGIYYFTREGFFTLIFLNIAISMLAMYLLLFKLKGECVVMKLLGAIILCFSKAYTDFSTSGLESSLSFLLFVLFMMFYFKEDFTISNLFAVLLMMNRLDFSTILFPMIFLSYVKGRKYWKRMTIPFVGFGMWLLFNIFYYGFAFPNTYYIKAKMGIAQSVLWKQGLLYIGDSMDMDPVTLLVILSGIAFIFMQKSKLFSAKIEAIGIIGYLIYVVSIGGCFMSGRFFAVPLLVTILLLTKYPISDYAFGMAFAIILMIGIINPFTPIKATTHYGAGLGSMGDSGIADERGGYYKSGYGLLRWFRGQKMPREGYIWEVSKMWNEKFKDKIPKIVAVFGLLGPEAYHSRNDIFFFSDDCLADPLRSKLPCLASRDIFWWRIGHYNRPVLQGYRESIFLSKNMIVDPDIKSYYEVLRHVIRDPLWDWNRIKLAFRLGFGRFDYLIENYWGKHGYTI